MLICFDSPYGRVAYDDRKTILAILLRAEKRAVSTFNNHLKGNDEQETLYLIRDPTPKKIKMDLSQNYHCSISR